MTKISHTMRSTHTLSGDFVSSIPINISFSMYAAVLFIQRFHLFQCSVSSFSALHVIPISSAYYPGHIWPLGEAWKRKKTLDLTVKKAENTFPDIDALNPVSYQFRFKHKSQISWDSPFSMSAIICVCPQNPHMNVYRTMSHGTLNLFCWITWFEQYWVSLTTLQTHCWVGPSEVTELYFLSGITSFCRCQYIFPPQWLLWLEPLSRNLILPYLRSRTALRLWGLDKFQ